ncbi:LemA family protein [Mycoplasmopsis glycophila]|uniref:LemA family n=1 Tax=Mycoplasmopsis glycophila TaxID=171285 RepID=A0A449AUP3_9BACT|nr:LemA family protein [Mycoplasmopsis glycophila]VEU70244.1 LemA family [Mycoplasmopsis glycophila]
MSNLFDPTYQANQERAEFNPNADNRPKSPSVSPVLKTLFWISCILILPLIYYIVKKNTFLKMQNSINDAASGVDVQLAKRADTLTKLADQVKSYKKHEASVFEEVAQYRSLLNSGNTIQNSAQIEALNTSILGRLMAIYENYPELKASVLYQELMDQTTYIEREIAATRRLYNSKVTRFNTEIFMFPASIVASSMHLSTMPLYVASSKQRQDVSMKDL